MKIPFTNDAGNCYFTHSPYYSPSPEPCQGDESDEPSSIWPDVEYPGIVTAAYKLLPTRATEQAYG